MNYQITLRKLTILILGFVAILVIACLSSCSNTFYAKQCSRRFPIIENVKETIVYTPGKEVIINTPGIEINCDSIVQAAKVAAEQSGGVYIPIAVSVPCPPSYYRIDSVKSKIQITQKDTAALYLLYRDVAKLKQQVVSKSEKITKQAKTVRRLSFLLAGIGLIAVIAAFLKFYLKVPFL